MYVAKRLWVKDAIDMRDASTARSGAKNRDLLGNLCVSNVSGSSSPLLRLVLHMPDDRVKRALVTPSIRLRAFQVDALKQCLRPGS